MPLENVSQDPSINLPPTATSQKWFYVNISLCFVIFQS